MQETALGPSLGWGAVHSDLGTRGGGGLALQGAIAGWPGEEAPCNPKDMDLGLGHLGGGERAQGWP